MRISGDRLGVSMKKRRLKLYLCFSVILAFLIYVLFCSIYKKMKYGPYIEASEKFMIERKTNEKYKGFVVNASPSKSFLRFSGNLAVTQTVMFNVEDGSILNDSVDLIIWPRLFGRYETRVQIETADGKGYAFYVDTKMNLIDETSETRMVYDKYYEVIAHEFQIAHDVFGIYDKRE